MSSKPTTVLSFRNVTKKYCSNIDLGRRRHFLSMLFPFVDATRLGKSDFLALQDVSFSITSGERVAVLGSPQSGKSTIARLAAQLSAPSRGRVKVFKSVRIVQPGKLALERPLMTVEMYCQTAASLLGAPWGQVKSVSEEILSECNLEPLRKVRIRDLPLGKLNQPTHYACLRVPADIFIFDQAQLRVFPDLEQTIFDNKTVIFMVAGREQIPSFCTRTLLLRGGKILFDGPTVEAKSVFASLPTEETTFSPSGTTGSNGNDLQLEEERKRKGSGVLRYVSAEILNGPPKTGEPLRLRFVYKRRISGSAKYITNATVIIEDKLGARVAGAPARILKEVLGEVHDDGTLYFEMDRLPLLPGQYYLTYDIHVDGLLSDKVVGKFKLDVQRGDFYKTGELPSKGMGPFCVGFHWDHNPPTTEDPQI